MSEFRVCVSMTKSQSDLRISCSVLDPDWGADEAKGFADLVFQEALVGEMEFHGAVCEKDERWRGNRGLRHVENLYARLQGDGGAFEIDLFDETVHLAGSDALAAFGGDFFEQRENSFDALAGAGGNEDNGSVVDRRGRHGDDRGHAEQRDDQ